MKHHTLGAAGLLWLALATAAAAQGTDAGVLLRYHFQPGQELRYRLTLSGDMPMEVSGIALPPGAKMPGKVPIKMDGTYEMVENVKSVAPEGTATITVGINKMDSTVNMMNMSIVTHLGADGKVETLVNGKPVTVPNAPTRALPNPLYEGTIDPTGKITGVNPASLNALNQLFGGQNVSSLFNGVPGVGGLVLPTQPIKPGDTWDTQFDLTMPVPVPGPAGPATGGAPPGMSIPMHFVLHNQLLRVEEGRAVIATQMTAAVPAGTKMAFRIPGAPPGLSIVLQKMDESMSGTVQFPIEQGVVESGDYQAKLAMQMTIALPPGTPGAPAKTAAKRAPAHASHAPMKARKKPAAAAPVTPPHIMMSVDGTLQMKVEHLAAPPPAAAAP